MESNYSDDNPWELDDDDEDLPGRIFLTAPLARSMEKNSSSPKSTTHLQFRCPDTIVRRMDVLLSAGHPALKTRTDIIIDAVFNWFNEWDKVGPDGANGMLRAQFAIYKMRLERMVKSEFLVESKETFDDLKSSGDVKALRSLYHHLEVVYSDSLTDSPQSYLSEIEELMAQVHRLLVASEKRVE